MGDGEGICGRTRTVIMKRRRNNGPARRVALFGSFQVKNEASVSNVRRESEQGAACRPAESHRSREAFSPDVHARNRETTATPLEHR